jgi:hypothetical protein
MGVIRERGLYPIVGRYTRAIIRSIKTVSVHRRGFDALSRVEVDDIEMEVMERRDSRIVHEPEERTLLDV